jgi:GNAT superfamily N-acetyltransferase
MEIVVRRAAPEDAASLAAVEALSWRAAYQGLMPDAFLDGLSHEQMTTDWHQNLLKHGLRGRKRVLVAVADAGEIGFVRVGLGEDEDEIGLLYLLYVLPEYWGRGVGKVLMQAAMDELQELVLVANLLARPDFIEAVGLNPKKIESETLRAMLKVVQVEGRPTRLLGRCRQP